jgi:flagellar motor switch protein FliG
MGREQAATVLRNLRETEVTQIMAEVARLRSVDQDTVTEVLQEFQLTAEARKQIATGGVEVARELLEESVGTQKASEIFEHLSLAFVAALRFLRQATIRARSPVPQDEHPQTIAGASRTPQTAQRWCCQAWQSSSARCGGAWPRWTRRARSSRSSKSA